MPIAGDGNLYTYVLNVGQADTSVIVTPGGQLIIIDARNPGKLVNLLGQLGLQAGDHIDHLVITHPHDDHFSGANRLANDYVVLRATLAPFWNAFGMGCPTYQKLVARLQASGTSCTFLSGYGRWYPDGTMTTPATGTPSINPSAPYLEFMGPSNNLLKNLQAAGELDTNHLSVMSRLTWRNFRMIFAADAQMENWAAFDQEGLLAEPCYVLKSAHHGSCNGTQWERLHRLSPKCVLISSDPGSKDNLPDAVGATIFAKYSLIKDGSGNTSKIVAVTEATGTVRITVLASGTRRIERFDEDPGTNVNLANAISLTWTSNPTDWEDLATTRFNAMYP